MKHCILLFFFFGLSMELDAQIEFSGASVTSNCKQSDQFEKDKRIGIVKVYKAGAQSLSKTFQRVLLRKYNVQLIETDLFVIADTMLCYNKFSIPYIQKKYGKSVFTRSKIEANKLDRTGQGDAWTKFKKNQEDSLRNFIYERIDPMMYKKYLKSERKEFGSYYYLQVDKTGKIYKSYGAGLKQLQLDSIVNTVVQQAPFVLIPALSDGFPTKGKIALKLIFNAETLKQYYLKEEIR